MHLGHLTKINMPHVTFQREQAKEVTVWKQFEIQTFSLYEYILSSYQQRICPRQFSWGYYQNIKRNHHRETYHFVVVANIPSLVSLVVGYIPSPPVLLVGDIIRTLKETTIGKLIVLQDPDECSVPKSMSLVFCRFCI